MGRRKDRTSADDDTPSNTLISHLLDLTIKLSCEHVIVIVFFPFHINTYRPAIPDQTLVLNNSSPPNSRRNLTPHTLHSRRLQVTYPASQLHTSETISPEHGHPGLVFLGQEGEVSDTIWADDAAITSLRIPVTVTSLTVAHKPSTTSQSASTILGSGTNG